MRLLLALAACIAHATAEVVYVRSDAAWASFKETHADGATIALFDETHPTSLIQLDRLSSTFVKRSPGVVLAAVHAPDVAEFKNAPMPHVFQLAPEETHRRRLSGARLPIPWGSVDERTLPEHVLIFVNEHGRGNITKAVRESAAKSAIPHLVVSLEWQSKERVVANFAAAHGPEHRAFRMTHANNPAEADVLAQISFLTAAEFWSKRERLAL